MKGRQQRLVVGPKLELAALQSIPEVVDGGEGGQQLPVKAEYLHSVEDNFLEKKPSGRQPFTSCCCRMLQDTPNVGVRCISGQRQLCVGQWVCQWHRLHQGILDSCKGHLHVGGPHQDLQVTFQHLCEGLKSAGRCGRNLQ